MTPQDLLVRIRDLPPETPRYRALERALGQTGTAYYEHQKEHWQAWLGAYDGPGAYGRADWASRDAKFIWNHFQCVTGHFWIAEALGMPEADLDRAHAAVLAAPKKSASQCAALRKVFPWPVIEAALPPPPKAPLGKLKALLTTFAAKG